MIRLPNIKRKIKLNTKSITIRDQILIILIINNPKILDKLISTIIFVILLVKIRIMIDMVILITLIIITLTDKEIKDILKNKETIFINLKMIPFIKIKKQPYNVKLKKTLNKQIRTYFNRSIKIFKYKIKYKLMFIPIKMKKCMK